MLSSWSHRVGCLHAPCHALSVGRYSAPHTKSSSRPGVGLVAGTDSRSWCQVKEAYINFLNHCYIDTEVEMKEIYTSHHIWTLFEKSFLVDIAIVANSPHDKKHADSVSGTSNVGGGITS